MTDAPASATAPDRSDFDAVEDYVEQAVDHVDDQVDRATRQAETAQEAAARADDAAQTVGATIPSVVSAQQVHDSTDLVDEAVPYVAPARPEPSPPCCATPPSTSASSAPSAPWSRCSSASSC